MDLYLHIGTEKTGTSSIQNFFHANRERFKRDGVLYPLTPGKRNQTALAAAAQQLGKRGPLRKSLDVKTDQDVLKLRAMLKEGLREELSAGRYRAVVMSGEHCSSRLLEDDEVAWLKDLVAPFFEEMRIIVYLRRQDDYLLSIYSTAVKSGATFSLRLPPQKTVEQRYDYWDLLSRWARVFGRERIVCRKFERSAMKNGDVVDDFLAAIGLQMSADYERPPSVNESLDAESLEFLRLFNRHVPRFAQNSVNPERDNVVGLLSRMSRGPLVTLSDAELSGFMAEFRESNLKVAQEYFGGARGDSDDPLFERRSDSRPRIASPTLTVERAVEICAGLWQGKQAQIDRIAERARRRDPGPGRNRQRRARGMDGKH
ncbi:MAG TPA: hypothetical protein VHC42_06325 [Rhizomicrobium sp.]|nr:hypothetical protein [Rhizomicrobium sp.]